MLKYLVAIPLILHGLANLSGFLAPWIKGNLGFSDSSWVFYHGVTIKSNFGRLFSLVWLASTLCLVASGVGILLGQGWWLPLAIAGCVLSIVAILPWWKAVPAGARFGAIFDLIVIILLLTPLGARITEAIQ